MVEGESCPRAAGAVKRNGGAAGRGSMGNHSVHEKYAECARFLRHQCALPEWV